VRHEGHEEGSESGLAAHARRVARRLELVSSNSSDIVVGVRDDEIRAAAALAESEHRYRLLAENATDVVYSIDTAGTCNWVSPSVTEVLGWVPEEFVGRHVASFMHPDDLAVNMPKFQQIMAEGGARGHAEMRYRTADGSWRWMSLTGRAMRDERGALLGGIESLRDIQAEVDSREALEKSERQFRLAMHGSPAGMAVVGLDRTFVSVNPALCEMLGRTEEWLCAHGVDDVQVEGGTDDDHLTRTRLLAGEQDDHVGERVLVTVDGQRLDVLHSIGLLRDHERQPLFFVSQFIDITARKTAEAHLEFAATHDALTGLANRAHLVDEIHRASARATGPAARRRS
jgi:PAS domain S-box-containing protein